MAAPQANNRSLRRKKVKPFRMSSTTITIEAFARFIEDTGYQTEADGNPPKTRGVRKWNFLGKISEAIYDEE